MKTSGQKQASLLDDMIREARAVGCQTGSDAVLFMGQPTDPIPRALIQDRDLPPWARLLWCYFRQLSDSPAMAGAAGDYDSIQEKLGIGSRGTVSAALHALRVTRWVTLLPPASSDGAGMDSSGAVWQPNIYLLHNMPLSFTEAMEMDPGYADHIAEAVKSPSKSVRILARRMLDGAMMSGPGGEFQHEIYRLAGTTRQSDARSSIWYQYQRSPEVAEQVEIEAVTACREDRSRWQEDEGELNFHADLLGLSQAQTKLMEVKIQELLPEYRQPYLDDLAVRKIEGENGNPLQNPVSYLMWQVNEHCQGNVTLTGKGERLPGLLKERLDRAEKRRWSKHRERLRRLESELDSLDRLLGYRGPDGELNEELLDQKRRVENEMSELREQMNGSS